MVNVLNVIVDKIKEKIFVESTDENSVYDYNNFVIYNKVKGTESITENKDNEDDTLTFKQFIK